MKILEVRISNLLSFAHKADFNTASPDISFDEKMNILVGANGSGKSNFADIIFTLFQTYFTQQYQYVQAFDVDRSNNPSLLTKRTDFGNGLRLTPHLDTPTQPSKLFVRIKMGEADKKNINFIKQNIESLREISSEFTQGGPGLPGNLFNNVNIDNLADVSFLFSVKNNRNNRTEFLLQNDHDSPARQLVDYYLTNLDFIKKLIEIGQIRKSKQWETLEATFEFMGSHRAFNSFPTTIELASGQENVLGQFYFDRAAHSIKETSNASNVFGTINAKVGRSIRRSTFTSTTRKEAIQSHFEAPSSLYSKVNDVLRQYLNLSVRFVGVPSDYSDTLRLEIFNCSSSKKIEFEMLSSGQKSIFTLIFLVCSSKLDGGFIMIDEPEVHLHPRLQKKYFELLKRFSLDNDLQAVLITHSPVFIDEASIRSVHRFFNLEGATSVIRPDNIDESDAELIRFLSYTNSAKVFFTNKVILTEGDTDNFFFTFFLSTFSTIQDDIEFLDIGGKNNQERWFKFLDKFKIKRYLITDFDFINKPESFGDIGANEARFELASANLDANQIAEAIFPVGMARNQIKDNGTNELDRLLTNTTGTLTPAQITNLRRWAFLNRQNKFRWKEVAQTLEGKPGNQSLVNKIVADLSEQRIHVLRWGDLEDYLDLDSKGLNHVIAYCTTNRTSIRDRNDKFMLNLRAIFNMILSD